MASSISLTDEVVISSPRMGRYLRWRRNIFYFLFRTLRLKMTALYKSGDTIYQRTVKLNVSGLTEPHAARGRGVGHAEGVTRARKSGVQPMRLPLVQASSRGRTKPRGAREECI